MRNLPALITQAERMLATAANFEEVKRVHDEIEALRLFAKKIGADTRKLGEVKIEAEARLGEEIAKAPKAKGTRGQGRPKKGGRTMRPPNDAPTLKQRGIKKSEASRYQQVAKIPKAKREKFYKTASEVTTSGLLKANGTEIKKERRKEREAELATKIVALPDERYGVIYCDPEYQFEVWSRETGLDRAADNHYPTSTLDVIKSRPVEKIAAKDCVLFLWATVPMEAAAHEIMKAWGFEYKSQVIWDKGIPGTAIWFKNQHEILLVGTRGNVPAPAPGTQWPSVIKAPRGKHSEKPAIFYELIEAYFPNLPKIELNARKPRLGWTSWGNEV